MTIFTAESTTKIKPIERTVIKSAQAFKSRSKISIQKTGLEGSRVDIGPMYTSGATIHGIDQNVWRFFQGISLRKLFGRLRASLVQCDNLGDLSSFRIMGDHDRLTPKADPKIVFR
jgi:hypothetical protein